MCLKEMKGLSASQGKLCGLWTFRNGDSPDIGQPERIRLLPFKNSQHVLDVLIPVSGYFTDTPIRRLKNPDLNRSKNSDRFGVLAIVQ